MYHLLLPYFSGLGGGKGQRAPLCRFFCGPDNLSSILLNHNITLMHSCKVDLVDVTLVVVDGNSKLIDVDVRAGNALYSKG